MTSESKRRKRKHPVSYKEFERVIGMIREQARDYPQEALEDIFLHLEMIEKRYGIAETFDEEVSQK
jgi:hypothetical protein